MAAFNPGAVDKAPDPNDWISNTKRHVELTNGYERVQVLMTQTDYDGRSKWTKTDMVGVLRLVQIKEFQGFPSAVVQLRGTDRLGIERAIIFDYELPFNFNFERNMSSKLCSIRLGNGQFIGFYFSKPGDYADFCSKLSDVRNKMAVTNVQLEALR